LEELVAAARRLVEKAGPNGLLRQFTNALVNKDLEAGVRTRRARSDVSRNGAGSFEVNLRVGHVDAGHLRAP
jgi:hypothetical protein